MPSVRLHLVDVDREVTRALRAAFARFPEVSVATGNVLAVARHVLVSPANSSGFMDGGIDAAYAAHFGPDLARRVRDAVRARPDGIVPVGSSLIVETGHGTVPFERARDVERGRSAVARAQGSLAPRESRIAVPDFAREGLLQTAP